MLIWVYLNKIRYVGDYEHGVKSGEGTIYNEDNSIAYSGEFKNGRPNDIGGGDFDSNCLAYVGMTLFLQKSV